MKSAGFLFALVCISAISYGQVPNDDCTTAMDYGVFPFQVQPLCPNGGSPYVGDDDDLGSATPSTPYYYMTGCQGYTSATTMLADDIWYKYRGGAPATHVWVQGADTLHINFYYGINCSNLQPSGCFTYLPSYSDTIFSVYSNTDTVNYYNYIQISSNVSGKQFWNFVCIDQPAFTTSVPAYGTVHLNNSVSLGTSPGETGIRVTPNPASTQLEVYSTYTKPLILFVFDLTSRKVLGTTFTSHTIVDIGNLPNGMYLYKIMDDLHPVQTGQFSKQ